MEPRRIHVISSGIDPKGWTPVPEDTAAMVDLASHELRRVKGWRSR